MSGLLPPFADYPLMARQGNGTRHRLLQCRECGEERWHEVLEVEDGEERLECACGHRSILIDATE